MTLTSRVCQQQAHGDAVIFCQSREAHGWQQSLRLIDKMPSSGIISIAVARRFRLVSLKSSAFLYCTDHMWEAFVPVVGRDHLLSSFPAHDLMNHKCPGIYYRKPVPYSHKKAHRLQN